MKRAKDATDRLLPGPLLLLRSLCRKHVYINKLKLYKQSKLGYQKLQFNMFDDY